MKTFSSFRNSFSGGRLHGGVALLISCLLAGSGFAQSSTGSSSATAERPTTTGATKGGDISGNQSVTADAQNAVDPTRARDTSATSLKRADRRFITKAAESNQKEMAVAQLAAQRATQPDVRSFAQELVSSHQRMNTELMQIAQRKGVTLEWMDHSAMAANTSSSTMDASRNAGIATDHGAPRATGAAGTANTGASTGVTPNASTSTSSGTMNAGVSADLASDRSYRRLAKATGDEFDREYVDMLVEQHEHDVQMFEKAAKNAQDSEVRSFASSHLPALQAHLDRANSLMKSVAE